MASSNVGEPMSLDAAIDVVEETYEFMLAYAAQGRRVEEDGSSSGIRAYLERTDAALAVLAAAPVPAGQVLDVIRPDVAKAGGALRFWPERPPLMSLLV